MLTMMLITMIANLFITLIPTIIFEIPPEIMNSFGDVFHGIAYFLPLQQLLPLFIFMITLDFYELITKIIWRIKSFVPTLGK